jgi:hypothetical protein
LRPARAGLLLSGGRSIRVRWANPIRDTGIRAISTADIVLVVAGTILDSGRRPGLCYRHNSQTQRGPDEIVMLAGELYTGEQRPLLDLQGTFLALHTVLLREALRRGSRTSASVAA